MENAKTKNKNSTMSNNKRKYYPDRTVENTDNFRKGTKQIKTTHATNCSKQIHYETLSTNTSASDEVFEGDANDATVRKSKIVGNESKPSQSARKTVGDDHTSHGAIEKSTRVCTESLSTSKPSYSDAVTRQTVGDRAPHVAIDLNPVNNENYIKTRTSAGGFTPTSKPEILAAQKTAAQALNKRSIEKPETLAAPTPYACHQGVNMCSTEKPEILAAPTPYVRHQDVKKCCIEKPELLTAPKTRVRHHVINIGSIEKPETLAAPKPYVCHQGVNMCSKEKPGTLAAPTPYVCHQGVNICSTEKPETQAAPKPYVCHQGVNMCSTEKPEILAAPTPYVRHQDVKKCCIEKPELLTAPKTRVRHHVINIGSIEKPETLAAPKPYVCHQGVNMCSKEKPGTLAAPTPYVCHQGVNICSTEKPETQAAPKPYVCHQGVNMCSTEKPEILAAPTPYVRHQDVKKCCIEKPELLTAPKTRVRHHVINIGSIEKPETLAAPKPYVCHQGVNMCSKEKPGTLAAPTPYVCHQGVNMCSTEKPETLAAPTPYACHQGVNMCSTEKPEILAAPTPYVRHQDVNKCLIEKPEIMKAQKTYVHHQSVNTPKIPAAHKTRERDLVVDIWPTGKENNKHFYNLQGGERSELEGVSIGEEYNSTASLADESKEYSHDHSDDVESAIPDVGNQPNSTTSVFSTSDSEILPRKPSSYYLLHQNENTIARLREFITRSVKKIEETDADLELPSISQLQLEDCVGEESKSDQACLLKYSKFEERKVATVTPVVTHESLWTSNGSLSRQALLNSGGCEEEISPSNEEKARPYTNPASETPERSLHPNTVAQVNEKTRVASTKQEETATIEEKRMKLSFYEAVVDDLENRCGNCFFWNEYYTLCDDLADVCKDVDRFRVTGSMLITMKKSILRKIQRLERILDEKTDTLT